MEGHEVPQFSQGDGTTKGWYSYESQQPSDEDEDEPRLMIDTSEEDEDGSMSQSNDSRMGLKSLPLNFATNLSPERIKALAEATPTLDKYMKDMKIPPELDKLVKDASADLKSVNVPEDFIKALNTVMSSPNFQKAIYEMELSPSLEKALDEMKQFQQNQARNVRTSLNSTSICDKSGDVGDDPLDSLQQFVWRRWNALPNGKSTTYPGGLPPNIMISPVPYMDNQGCETVPVGGVSSNSPSSIRSSSNVKSSTDVRSSTKRAGAQQNSARGKRRSRMTPTHSSTSVSLLPVPPTQNHSKIDYVLNKLQTAARDEQQMQELRRMSVSTDMADFKRFQAYIKRRYKDVSVTPHPFPNATDRVRMGRMLNSVPLPPALTIIPKMNDQANILHKPSCRRSPPPMVPIESFSNLRRPLSDDQMVMRLKRLGTDIELERTTITPLSTPTQSVVDYGGGGMTEEDDDDDAMIPLSVDCILSTEPIVTIDERPDVLPLKYFDVDSTVSKKNVSRSSIPPPPPSLIPISSCTTSATSMDNRFMPLLPNLPKMANEGAKPKRKPKAPSFKSHLAKLAHALVQPAGAMKKNNEVEIMNVLRQPSSFPGEPVTMEREVEIFKIKEKTVKKNSRKQDNASQNSIETIVKRLKEKPIENKTVTEFTTANDDEAATVPSEAPPSELPPLEASLSSEALPLETQKDLQAVNNDIQLIEDDIKETNEKSEPNDLSASESTHTAIEIQEVPAEKIEKTNAEEVLVSPEAESSSSSTHLFTFHPDSCVTTTSLETGRKLYECKICSGVYCKMYSAKKHYIRTHVNPRMVTEEDALKFGLETSAKKSPADEGFYRCNECNEIFVEMLDLKKHLLVHPVAANESSERSRKYAASYHCDKCDLTFSKKKLYYKHLSGCAKVDAPVQEPKDTAVLKSKDEIVAQPPKDVPVPKSEDTSVSEPISEPKIIVSEPKKASVPESNNVADNQNNHEESDEEKKDALGISRMCLFCDLTFTSATARKTHVLQQHHPKRKQQSCSYCKNKKFTDLKDLLKHICQAHSKRYFGCALCKIRFKTKDDLTAHNAESHTSQEVNEASLKTVTVDAKTKPASTVLTKSGKVYKCAKCSKTFPSDKDLKRHRKKGHNVGKQTAVKSSGSSLAYDPYEQKYRTTSVASTDYETEFYKNARKNVRLNLDFYLDGKINDTIMLNDSKTVTRSGSSHHLKTRSSTSQYLQIRMERQTELTFKDMYGAENVNGPFIANMSRLHLATQMELLRKANPLQKEPKIESVSTTSMAKELALTENSGNTEVIEDLENSSEAVFTGEWTRPKKYICSTCFARFSNFWDMEDHRWMKHPNVWVSNYEFPADQAPGSNWDMKRCLSSDGVLSPATKNSPEEVHPPTKCTKCQKVVTPTAEFHKHILECGGDTTWMSTMFASSSLKKHKKWRPYGGRRRKNIGRVRGLKRNIPTTPVKIIGMSKNRQKAGDTETIQKMIANLPPKRITRRIVQFDDIESKNQNRNSNESNILTRKRKEKLAAKVTAEKPSAEELPPIKIPDAKKKKQKEGATTTTSVKKSTKSTKSKLPTAEVTTPTETPEQIPDALPSIPPTDVPTMEEGITISLPSDSVEEPKVESPPSVAPLDLGPVDVVKQEDEDPELDLESIEPADSNTDSCIPDSSIILAAMRETMRQTDAVIPSQTFTVNTKKRKRDDLKCKPEPTEVVESSVEPENECPAIAPMTCKECKAPFSASGSDTQVCEKCTPKRGKTRAASLRGRERNGRLPTLRVTRKKSSVESPVELADSKDSSSLNVKLRKSVEVDKEVSVPKTSKSQETTNSKKSKKSVTKVEKTDAGSKISKITRNMTKKENAVVSQVSEAMTSEGEETTPDSNKAMTSKGEETSPDSYSTMNTETSKLIGDSETCATDENEVVQVDDGKVTAKTMNDGTNEDTEILPAIVDSDMVDNETNAVASCSYVTSQEPNKNEVIQTNDGQVTAVKTTNDETDENVNIVPIKVDSDMVESEKNAVESCNYDANKKMKKNDVVQVEDGKVIADETTNDETDENAKILPTKMDSDTVESENNAVASCSHVTNKKRKNSKVAEVNKRSKKGKAGDGSRNRRTPRASKKRTKASEDLKTESAENSEGPRSPVELNKASNDLKSVEIGQDISGLESPKALDKDANELKTTPEKDAQDLKTEELDENTNRPTCSKMLDTDSKDAKIVESIDEPTCSKYLSMNSKHAKSESKKNSKGPTCSKYLDTDSKDGKSEPKKNSKGSKSPAEPKEDGTDTNIVTCEVCQRPSIRSICDKCSSIARKNKICVFCKRENTITPKTNSLPVCEVCKEAREADKVPTSREVGISSKRELVEWTLCKVCRRPNHKVVCSSCIAMARKHKICARCSIRWDHAVNGLPVCKKCAKIWYRRQMGENIDSEEYIDSGDLLTTEVALQKLCNPKGPRTRRIQVKDVENALRKVMTETNRTTATPAPVANASVISSASSSTVVPVISPSTSSAVPSSANSGVSVIPTLTASTSAVCNTSSLTPTKTIPEDGQSNASSSKKKVLLICKGCFGLYDKVSTYKEHCATCSARVSCIEEKKPLLGFVKRNATVAPNDVNTAGPINTAGPSFEILEGVQIKSYPLTENVKSESDLANDVPVPGAVYDSDSSTSSKRLELSNNPKTKRSFATDESMKETIESVIRAGSDDSASEMSPLTNPVSHSDNPGPSGNTAPVPVSGLKNFEKVKNLLEISLEASNAEEEISAEISFSNEEENLVPEASNAAPKKRKSTPPKTRVQNKSRATRSSLTSSEMVEEPKQNEKITKKRKANNDVSPLADEETVSEDVESNTIAKRLRWKPQALTTKRTLRSRVKVPHVVEDIKEVKKPARKGVKRKLSESSEPLPKNESIESDRKMRKVSNESDEVSPSSVFVPNDDANTIEMSDATTIEMSDATTIEMSDATTNQMSDATTDEMPNATNNDISDTAATQYPIPILDENHSNFLSTATPSTSVPAYDESSSLNGFSYDDPMRIDGYETSGPSYFDENQTDGTQPTTWYSAINFLDQSSLGSILDSVNELLSRPEVSSSVADTIAPQTVPENSQNNDATFQNSNDGAKTKDDASCDQEDESPTLIDLDHQTTNFAEVEEKKENTEKPASLDEEQASEPSPSTSAESSEEICEVCEQTYPDSKAMKLHMLSVHQVKIPTTRIVLNGKTCSSTRTNQNGVKNNKQKCSHCQKILVGKAEMAMHVQEHLKTLATNKNSNADFLKKCIAEKLEDLFLNKALDNYMRSPTESSNVRNNPPLKIFSQLNAAKKSQSAPLRSAILAEIINLDSSPSEPVPSTSKAGQSSSASPSTSKPIKQSKKASTSTAKVLKSDPNSNDPAEPEDYPCPMCPKRFPLTHLRNQHLIMVHAPRTSTHPTKKESPAKSKAKNDKNGPSETSGQSDGKVIRSYLLNESVNSCIEAKKEAVTKAMAESSAKNAKELSKPNNGPADASNSQSVADTQAIEGPPALEPAPSGEQILNNTDRSPPKLEASTGVLAPRLTTPSILRQNLTVPATTSSNPPPSKNGKPCRKKMSKKEIDLPPAVVKFKAEQALLELSINKFRKIRS